MNNNGNSAYEAPRLFTKIYQLLMRFPLLQNIRAVFYYVDAVFLLFIRKPRRGDDICKKRLLLVLSFALGDCVLFMKAMEAIRELYPRDEWEITVTCQGACKSLFEGIADRIVGLGFTQASVSIKKRYENYRILRDTYYDVVLDPISSSDCSPNIFATRAACGDKKIGVLEWEPRAYQCPDKMRHAIYDEIIPIKGHDLHRIRLYEEVVRYLAGMVEEESRIDAGVNLRTYIGTPAKLREVPLPAEVILPEEFFILFPSASLPVKKWPLDRCARLIDFIYEKTGLPLVLIGTEHDRVDAEHVLGMIKSEVEIVDVIGKTGVLELSEVIKRASFVVTNDTSVYHIAVAGGVDTFLLCGGYVYKRFAKYEYEGYNNPVLINAYRECYDCNNNCKYDVKDTYPCVKDVTYEMVKDRVGEYLNKRNA